MTQNQNNLGPYRPQKPTREFTRLAALGLTPSDLHGQVVYFVGNVSASHVAHRLDGQALRDNTAQATARAERTGRTIKPISVPHTRLHLSPVEIQTTAPTDGTGGQAAAMAALAAELAADRLINSRTDPRRHQHTAATLVNTSKVMPGLWVPDPASPLRIEGVSEDFGFSRAPARMEPRKGSLVVAAVRLFAPVSNASLGMSLSDVFVTELEA